MDVVQVHVAQPEGEPTPTIELVPTPTPAFVGAPSILDKPNSGQAPTQPRDRGGAEQLGLLLAIVVAVVVIGALIWRESRRRRRPLPAE